MFGNQTTIPQDRRYQDTYEDRTCGIQHRFNRPQPTRTHEEDVRDNLWPPSHENHQRQAQLHTTHRMSTTFQHDPFRQDAAVASTSNQWSCPEAAHPAASGHYPGNSTRSQWSDSEAAHSAASGHDPDHSSSTGNDGYDRRFDSAFYRNATYTSCSNTNPVPPPFALMERPNLEPFDGDVRKYPRFRDRFLLITEAQPNIAPRYKLLYLLQHLRGEPLKLADPPRITDGDYFAVLDLLEERYGDKEWLTQLLFDDLLNLPPPRSTKQSDMIQFHDTAFQIVCDLELLCSTEKMNYYDEALSVGLSLLSKLHEDVESFLIARIEDRNEWSIDGVLSGLRHIISRTRSSARAWTLNEDPDIFYSRDDTSSTHTSSDGSSEESSDGSDHSQVDDVAVAAVANQRLKERRTCPLCGLLHTAFRCTVFTNINARLRRIQKLKLCLLCLREGHKAATCPRKTTDSCRICHKGPHNRAVCMTANGRTRAGNRRRSPVRATTGSSVDPQRTDQKRYARKKKSVDRAGTTSVSAATHLRQSETQSRSVSTPKTNRKKKSKKRGAAPPGRDGTSRPSTTSTAESMKQNTADAYGDGRLLPARQGILRTDRCSKHDESTQFDRAVMTTGTTRGRASDAVEQQELRETEEDSSSESSGGSSDTSQTQPEEPRDSTMLHLEGICCASSTDESTLIEQQDNGGYAVSEPVTADTLAVLLECARATAVNQRTGVSRDVIVFFDSGSDRSFATTTLLHDLDLPRHGTRSLRISTFGSTLPTTVEGVSTSIVLQSQYRRLPSLAFIARDCIVPSVRTALVEQSDLPMLRRNDCRPTSTITTPDILIGQDLVSHFQRQYGPPLPSGFHVIHSILGPMVGGSGKVANIEHAAATTVRAASAADVFIRRPPEADTTLTMTPSLQRTTCRSHLPTRLVVECTDIEPQSASAHTVEADTKSRLHPDDSDFSLTVENHKFSGNKMSTPVCEVRHTLLDCTAGGRETRKHPNPLDNTAPLPLLISTSHVLLPSEPPSSGPNNINACCADLTFPGDHVPDIVLVAVTDDAEPATQAHGSRLPEVPSSISGQQLRNPTHTVGLRTKQPVHHAPGPIEIRNTHEEAPITALKEGRHTLLTCLNPCIDQPCRRTVNHCRKPRGNPSIDIISTRPHLVTGRAPRADHADQGDPHHSSVNDATNLAANGQAVQATDFDDAPRGKRKVQCAYCGRPHFSARCNIYHSIKQRLNRLRQLNHCLLCLKPGHWSNACPNRKDVTCPHCANPHAHHVSLCRAYVSRRPGRSPTEQGPPSRTAPAAHQGTAPAAAVQRNSAKKKVRAAPPATHSVARGANSTGLSTAISTFPTVLNHFCRSDESSPATHSKARDDSHSVNNSSAAVPSPAQAPSRQPSRTGRKGTVAASSGRTRLEQQRREPDAAERTRAAIYTARDANPVKPNRRNRATHGEKTEHSSRDAKNHHRSKDLHQEPLAETSAEPTQHADIRCEFCTLHHRAERCISFCSIEKRRQRSQYLWLCFACLAQDHRTEDCPNVGKYTCPLCRDDGHHQALCAATSRPVIDQADAFSTLVAVPAEAHQRALTPHTAVPDEDHQQEPTKAEHRRKPRKRKNRKSQK